MYREWHYINSSKYILIPFFFSFSFCLSFFSFLFLFFFSFLFFLEIKNYIDLASI